MATVAIAPRVIKNGFVATLRKARRCHQCQVGEQPIEAGEDYYSIVKGGGGLGWLKFPDRCHIDCLDRYFKEHNGKY